MNQPVSRHRWRNSLITIFVIVWTLLYHYMSVKYFYLEPYFKRPLPRVPMLFPPAGWIMFYNVGDEFGEINVYGLKGLKIERHGQAVFLQGREYQRIDAHDIFRTRTIFFDNIHRGLIHGAVGEQKAFCDFLEYRFPYYDAFEIRHTGYPSITTDPGKRIERVYYQCLTQHYIKDELRP